MFAEPNHRFLVGQTIMVPWAGRAATIPAADTSWCDYFPLSVESRTTARGARQMDANGALVESQMRPLPTDVECKTPADPPLT